MADSSGNFYGEEGTTRGQNFIITATLATTADTLSLSPDAGTIWVIQNITADKKISIQYYDATNAITVNFESIDVTGGCVRSLEHFPCHNECYLQIVSAEDACDIVVTGRVEQ